MKMKNVKELLKCLQPFTQLGILSGKEAQMIVIEYRAGNDTPLREFIYSGKVPVIYVNMLQAVKTNFCIGGQL